MLGIDGAIAAGDDMEAPSTGADMDGDSDVSGNVKAVTPSSELGPGDGRGPTVAGGVAVSAMLGIDGATEVGGDDSALVSGVFGTLLVGGALAAGGAAYI